MTKHSSAQSEGSSGYREAVELEFAAATKRYPGAQAPAVDALSLTVPAGEICVLVGPSGCGKTTAMRMVNRMIDVISSYTVEGMIFSVDPRLRPMGRDGELVQTESAYKSYFIERAQAWEALTYMKSRAVAGDIEGGTLFHEKKTYVSHEGDLASPDSISFNHGLGEIISALFAENMRLTEFTEHDSVPWNPLGDAMVKDERGEWRLREKPERLAASYTLQAVKG